MLRYFESWLSKPTPLTVEEEIMQSPDNNNNLLLKGTALEKELVSPEKSESSDVCLMQSFLEQSSVFITGHELEKEEGSQPDKASELLKIALERMRNLERECNFLYEMVNTMAIDDDNDITQTCQRCGDAFPINSDVSCAYHPGELIQVTFRELPDDIVESYKPQSVDTVSPMQYWNYSCCNRLYNSAPCTYDRHVPVKIEIQLPFEIKPTETTRDPDKSCFHPTDSLVLYD